MDNPKRYLSGLDHGPKSLEMLGISADGLAHNGARQKATPGPLNTGPPDEAKGGPLGPPFSIQAVAAMLGCSAWTVRQKHIPDGLPHFRSGQNGKLIFFRDQVVAWILERQRKGARR